MSREISFDWRGFDLGPEPLPRTEPNTCSTCVSFEPQTKKREYLHGGRGEGWCRNKTACVGAVLPTNRMARCNHYQSNERTDAK